MARSACRRWVTLALLLTLTGCGTTRTFAPLAWMKRDRGPQSSLDDEKLAKKSPFVPSNRRGKPADAESEDDVTDTSIADRSGSNAAKPKPDAKSPHDAATLAAIDKELQDATPEEREQLRGDLAALNPAMVRLILGNRRMLRQMGRNELDGSRIEQTSAESGPSSVDRRFDATPPVQPAGGMPNGTQLAGVGHSPNGPSSFQPQVAGAGLGNMSPWGGRNPDPNVDPRVASGWNDGRPGSMTADQANPFGHTMNYAPSPHSPAPPQNQYALASSQQPSYAPPGATAWPLGHSQPMGVPANSAGMGPRSLGAPQGPPPQTGGYPARPVGHQDATSAYGTTDAYSASPEMQQLLSQAAAEAARVVPGGSDAERQDYIRKHVSLRMLYLVAGQQGRALEAIPGIEPADQEFWQQVFWGVANYFDRDGIPDPTDRAGQTIAQLRAAVLRLQENARLELRNVAFCRKILSYGNYERFERDEFTPGQPVLLYAEVANFKSEQTADGQHRTILKTTVEIYRAGPTGDLVEKMPFSATEDLCRNQRSDYFHSYEFTIPQRIALGPHVLKLVVEDQLSRKLATYTVNFTVK